MVQAIIEMEHLQYCA